MHASPAAFFVAGERWRSRYPGAVAAVLALRRVANPERVAALEQRKDEFTAEQRRRLAGTTRATLRELPPFPAYAAYLRPFQQNYHVLLQLESLALKERPLPRGAALVEAMFLAELASGLLTAGHDLDRLDLPVRLDVAEGGEPYTLLNGRDASLKPGDMYMADGAGIISSIVSGPDRRTPLSPASTGVLFAVYAPPGIGVAPVEAHLDALLGNVRLVAPAAEVVARVVLEAAAD